MSTINEKLSELNTVKGEIMNAINAAYNRTVVTASTPFGDYASYIERLCECAAPKHIITYHLEGGSGNVPTERVDDGESITLATYSGQKIGYTLLSGWAVAAGSTTPTYSFNETITPSADINLYAMWQANQEQYYYSVNVIDDNYENHPRVDYSDASQVTTTTTLTNAIDLTSYVGANNNCVIMSACVPSDVAKVEFVYEFNNVEYGVEFDEQNDSIYKDYITVVNVPAGYKVMLYSTCDAGTFLGTKIRITKSN